MNKISLKLPKLLFYVTTLEVINQYILTERTFKNRIFYFETNLNFLIRKGGN